MLSYIIINIIISIIIVFIIHYVWNIIQNNYFKKYTKTKDLVNRQMQKYKKIIEDLQKQKNTNMDEKTTSMEEDLEKFMEETVFS
jgi:predicted PurR-regulated permease PerM